MAFRNADGEDSENLTGCNWKEYHDQLLESALGAEEGSICVMHLLTLHCMTQRGLLLIHGKIVSDFKESRAR